MPMLEDVRVDDAPVENYRVDGVGLDGDVESPVHDESKRFLTTKSIVASESVAPSSILESAESMPLLEPAETEKQELAWEKEKPMYFPRGNLSRFTEPTGFINDPD